MLMVMMVSISKESQIYLILPNHTPKSWTCLLARALQSKVAEVRTYQGEKNCV